MHIQEAEEKTYLVKYRLPGEEGRNPRKVKVQAKSQADAKKAAMATIPNAKVIGGAKELDESALDFASRAAKFASRCVGRLCLAYANTPVRKSSKTGTMSLIRKNLTRVIARGVGSRFVTAGGGTVEKKKRVAKKKRK